MEEQETDGLERLRNLPDEYKNDSRVTERAKEYMLMQQQKKKRRSRVWIPAVASACVVIIGVVGFLGGYVFNKPNNEIRFYDEKSVEYTQVENISTYITENKLNVSCFSMDSVTSRVGCIQETGEVAVIGQSLVYINEGSADFDVLDLQILLMKNCEIDVLKTFNYLEKTTTVNNISVSYKVSDVEEAKQIQAKFEHEEIEYYLTIKTQDETGKIEQYVNMLFE